MTPVVSIAPTETPEDEQLMAQIQAGSTAAFEKLYDRFCHRAYRLAWWTCGDEGRAEDAVQEAFTAIWKNRASYLPARGSVAAWLLTTVRYRAIDIARRDQTHANHQTAEGKSPRHQPTRHRDPEAVLTQVVMREDAARMHDQLRRLPAGQRDVIALAFYGQMTHTEIATHLDLPTGTVKGRMRLGLNKLRVTAEKDTTE